jgi:hypothetical protein
LKRAASHLPNLAEGRVMRAKRVDPSEERSRNSAMSDPKPAPRAAPAPLVAVKGMNDILPPDSARWEWFEETVRALMRRYGYLNIRVPIVEPRRLRAWPGRSDRHRRRRCTPSSTA